jgi:hypothetical protein
MDGVVAGEVSSGIWGRLLCVWALPIHKLQCIHLFFSSDYEEVSEYQWRSYTGGIQVIETIEDGGIITS